MYETAETRTELLAELDRVEARVRELRGARAHITYDLEWALRERDLEDVVAHAITVREDWADLYGELAEAANDPELDPGDRFEMFASKTPSKEAILGSPQSDRNIYGMMR